MKVSTIMHLESRNREPATPGARPEVGKIDEGTYRSTGEYMTEKIVPRCLRT